MFRQGNAPPPASKKFVNSLDDVQLVNDEGIHSVKPFLIQLSLNLLYYNAITKITDMSKCIFYISDDKNCPVCLKNFEQDDIVNTLPCNHRFHSDCIKKWLEKVFEKMFTFRLMKN